MPLHSQHTRWASTCRRPPNSLREARAPLLRSGPRVRVGLWPTNTALPLVRHHPRPPILSLPRLPPSISGLPTPPPARPPRPQSCSDPFMLKLPNQRRDKSPASPGTSAAPFFEIPPRNFAANDCLTIEPKSQPGRKRGNQGKPRNWGGGIWRSKRRIWNVRNQKKEGRGFVVGTGNMERGGTRKRNLAITPLRRAWLSPESSKPMPPAPSRRQQLRAAFTEEQTPARYPENVQTSAQSHPFGPPPPPSSTLLPHS